MAAIRDYSIHDPPLSDIGIDQCAVLRENLRSRFQDSHLGPGDAVIVTSPMRRTLQTAHLALDWLTERGVKIIANADWQENSAKPCDTGSPVAKMKPLFPEVDFDGVDSIWPDKTSPTGARYAYTRSAILDRAQRGLRDLSRRPERLIFVVSHSGFLRLGVSGHWWFNSDYRIFDFTSSAGETPVTLQQDKSTTSGGLSLSWTESVELGSDLPDADESRQLKN